MFELWAINSIKIDGCNVKATNYTRKTVPVVDEFIQLWRLSRGSTKKENRKKIRLIKCSANFVGGEKR